MKWSNLKLCLVHGAGWAVGWSVMACASPTGTPGSESGDGDSATASGGKSGAGASSGHGDGDGDTGDGDIMLGDGDMAAPEPMNCAPRIVGLLRDFQAGGDIASCPVNQDFQNSWMNPVPDIGWQEPGIAAQSLGMDQKPDYSGGSFETVTSGATFEAWYRDDPDCNQTFEHELEMVEDPVSGNLVFESSAFFPLDGRGFGDSGTDDFGNMHNFHFTFELHMTFVYRGGEVFDFTGDDDLFVYIDGQLALDLGGVHAPQEGSIVLDDLGLVIGEEYPIDFFHAERSMSQSNFHIETSLQFSNCDPIIVR